MRNLRYDRIAVLLASILFWLFVCFTGNIAHADSAGGYLSAGGQESSIWGRYKRMWNATGSEIAEGTVVMVDTVASGSGPQYPYGKAFRTWDGAVGNVYRIVGVTIGNIPSFRAGNVLVDGYHNNILMAATGVAAGTKLIASLTVSGALAAGSIADSTNQAKPVIGVFHRYVSGSSLRGQAYLNFGAQPFNSKR